MSEWVTNPAGVSSVSFGCGSVTTGGGGGGSLHVSGNVEAKSFTIRKDPNLFVEYKFQIIDLRDASPTKNHDRVLFEEVGTIEVSPRQDLNQAIIVRHAEDIKDIPDAEDMKFVVKTLAQYKVE